MTDAPGSTPPFPGFPGFPPAEMLDRMWGMMRLTPFGSAFPGTQPGTAQGFVPSLSMMSDMMAPLTNVEELDKRITDMRAVEQWLKLNLNMLQSAIQALEVQRATLATLRAFGAFAQSSMSQPAAGAAAPESAASASGFATGPDTRATATPGAAPEAGDAAEPPAFDASGWWNLLQSQFNQIAQFAMTQPGGASSGAAGDPAAAAGAQGADDARPTHGKGAAEQPGDDADAQHASSAAKRAAARRPAGAKRASAPAAKKGSERPE